jgi:hypothetical protein
MITRADTLYDPATLPRRAGRSALELIGSAYGRASLHRRRVIVEILP